MEHYYVIKGNEYGVSLVTKKNFKEILDAFEYFESVKDQGFGCILMYVNEDGVEEQISIHTNESGSLIYSYEY